MLPRVTTRLVAALVFLGGALPPAVSADDLDVSVEKLRDHVAFLASDDLGGRDSGEPGLEVAAEYLARVFSDLGLEPAGDRGSFFQHFTVPFGADFGARLGVSVDHGDEVERSWAPWTEAFPMGFGESGPVDAPVVFAGYGITTSDDDREKGLEYNDYAGLDVKGKVVVILRFTPRSATKDGPFGGRRSPHAPFIAKLSLARKLGAAGVVFATPPGESPAGAETKSVENFRGFSRKVAPRHPTVPAILVPTHVLEELFERVGRNLEETVKEIDAELQPRSFALPDVRIRLDTRRGYRVLRNVAARLKGKGELARETVIIGGHYDHIGRYGSQVAARNFGEIHNGADDNASGVAGILELARVFSGRDEAPGRSLLFLCFSGEEIGLLGSRHWVKAPRRFRVTRATSLIDRSASPHHPHAPAPGGGNGGPSEKAPGGHPTGKAVRTVQPGTLLTATGAAAEGFIEVRSRGRLWIEESAVEQVAGPEPLSRVVAMVNLDMIGRAKDDLQVTVIGSDSSEVFAPLLDGVSKSEKLTVRRSRGMRGGGSDHAHFLRNGIPALFFFTGMHRQYNTPEDDLDRLNLDGMRRVVSLVASTVERLRAMPEAPPFSQSAAVASSQTHGRPKLGVVVDPRYRGRGARVLEVSEDSPAEGAGLQPGDAIIAFAGNRIDSYESLVAEVEEVSPGREIPVKLLRAGGTLEVVARFPGRSGGFRVSFGSVPDYAFEERGVRFDDIRPETAAALAGVKPGDVLVIWAGKEVEDVTHWTALLGAHKPGDEVKITVRRGDEKLELSVKLKAR